MINDEKTFILNDFNPLEQFYFFEISKLINWKHKINFIKEFNWYLNNSFKLIR